jgi:hypothetical protein
MPSTDKLANYSSRPSEGTKYDILIEDEMVNLVGRESNDSTEEISLMVQQ